LALSDWTLLVQTLGQLVAWAQLRSSGRDGSAIADELMHFGASPDWSEHLLQASVDAAQQVRADATLFNAAYDAGAL
jgi:hypothetical protein